MPTPQAFFVKPGKGMGKGGDTAIQVAGIAKNGTPFVSEVECRKLHFDNTEMKDMVAEMTEALR